MVIALLCICGPALPRFGELIVILHAADIAEPLVATLESLRHVTLSLSPVRNFWL